MDRILNSHTKTIHKHREDEHWHRTECGALTHVAEDHVRPVDEDDPRAADTATQCGRCFDESGGY